MTRIYLGLVIFLFSLAVVDLTVGVSNDAVNFLNSAIGSKVATFRTIIIVAALGIFLGAIFSTGMMDIARHGIFNPSYFTFKEVMTIFVAVMSSDIILLDFFNTLGLPTSTTVSMVFELLGGSFAIATLKAAGTPDLPLGSLLNTSKALSVITAIFFSVPIAFFFGLLIQYISRLIFTFTYNNKSLKWKIGLFGGIATTAISYFIIIKGIGDLSFLPGHIGEWIKGHTGQMILYVFVGSTILMEFLYFLKIDVLKILVLLGTFALAMSFAGNDLVNFIGVPLAGLSSYQDFAANGTDPSSFLMSSLNESARTPVFILAAAGVIMIFALATSKKAQNVVKTSVDLSRQDEGDEMFGSSRTARVLVRMSNGISTWIQEHTPVQVEAWINTRFNSEMAINDNGAAFDKVRATVNLVVASLLIALGTSLTLPLSTTYVTFMVAMGTSLADRAWSRESAVFRITGVISVIGGWFVTAAVAFGLSYIISTIMHFTGNVGTCIIAALAMVLIIRRNIIAPSKVDSSNEDAIYAEMMKTKDNDRIVELLDQHILGFEKEYLDYAQYAYQQITDGFMMEDLRMLSKATDALREERDAIKKSRRKEMLALRRLDPADSMEKNTWFHLGINSCEEINYSLRRICDPCLEHIDNNFTPMTDEEKTEFRPLRDNVVYMIKKVIEVIASGDFANAYEVRDLCNKSEASLSEVRKTLLFRMQSSKENLTTAYVYLNMIQESEQIIITLRHLLRAAHHYHYASDPEHTTGFRDPQENPNA